MTAAKKHCTNLNFILFITRQTNRLVLSNKPLQNDRNFGFFQMAFIEIWNIMKIQYRNKEIMEPCFSFQVVTETLFLTRYT